LREISGQEFRAPASVKLTIPPHDMTFKLNGEAVFGDGMTSFDGLAMLSAKF
jgi:hypothetical protein